MLYVSTYIVDKILLPRFTYLDLFYLQYLQSTYYLVISGIDNVVFWILHGDLRL